MAHRPMLTRLLHNLLELKHLAGFLDMSR